MKIYFDALIVGSGAVGLSIARNFLLRNKTVLVIEKEHRSGEGISSRNSGVIHAGIYYPSNSLKAKLCIEGSKLLYEYCEDKNISHTKTGKLIISANKYEHNSLKKLFKKGLDNGVDLHMLNKQEVREFEPSINCYSAIFSPNSGIIDVPEYINALEYDIQNLGGLISYKTQFLTAKRNKSEIEAVAFSDEKVTIFCDYLINSSGLGSFETLNNIKNLDKKYIKRIYYGKGHYFKYHGKNPFSHLIYPLPGKGGLGIHVGWDSSHQLRFGPDIVWTENLDYTFDASLKTKFLESIKNYWPEIDENKLQPDFCGIRPKLYQLGESQSDFSINGPNIHGFEGLISLQGIESPGLTSSPAIAEYVYDLVEENI